MSVEVVWRSEMVHATVVTARVRGRLQLWFALDGHVSSSLCMSSQDEARQVHTLARTWLATGTTGRVGALGESFALMLREVRAVSPRWSVAVEVAS